MGRAQGIGLVRPGRIAGRVPRGSFHEGLVPVASAWPCRALPPGTGFHLDLDLRACNVYLSIRYSIGTRSGPGAAREEAQ